MRQPARTNDLSRTPTSRPAMTRTVLATNNAHAPFVTTLESHTHPGRGHRLGNRNTAPFAVTLYRGDTLLETRYVFERPAADQLVETLPATAAHYARLAAQYAPAA